MRGPRRAITAAVGSAAFGVAAMLATTSPAAADVSVNVVLGAPSMQGACSNQFPGSTAYYSDPNNAYSWYCSRGGVRYGINLNQQCATQYGNPAWAATSNPSSVWSWYCYR